MRRFIVNLESKSALHLTCAGGKGANLAWLCKQGFNVPPGFAITPAAFRHFLSCFDLQALTRRRDWSQRDLERIRELLTACRIPDRLTRSICRAYRRLGGRVAVRSSMIGEDAGTTSFAGQLDTHLNADGEEQVLEAIRGCWASMFNWRLSSYLAERESRAADSLLADLSLAVVVQQMVNAQAAGVAFSAHPETGQRCVIIEAVRGLGEALVQGLVEPDRYFVDARGVLAEVKTAGADGPILHEGQVLQLAELVRDIARRARDPQDVEWAWDGAAFYLLQCRPVTSLVGRRVYSNRMVSDMSPGLCKPLVFSTKTVGMAANVFGRMFTELIGPNDVNYAALVKRIHSRLYTDITLLGELFERVGMPANFFEMISRDERSDFRHPPLTPKTLRALFRLLRFVWRHARPADEIDAFIERHQHALEAYRCADWSSETAHALLAQFDALLCLHGETQWYILIGPMNMMVRNRLLNRFVSQHAPDLVPSDLIRGLVGLKALEPNDALRQLAAQAAGLDGQTQRVLVEADDKAIRAALSGSDAGQALTRRMDAFLHRYGFLSANGTDLSATPWIENPALIWHAIGRAAACPSDVKTENVEAIRRQARQRVRSSLGRVQRFFFDRLLASTITYIDLRERSSFLMSEEGYQMRRILLALAQRLVARGDLGERDDIFFLTYDELQRLVQDQQQAEALQEAIAARQAEMQADALLELPDTICGDYVPTQSVHAADDQAYLVGICGSSGLAQGRACVVLDPSAAPVALSRDDILVVPFTDVGWTPLFSGVGGIVAETGGQLSHTSIVAREYGLPAVVSVRRATRLIGHGQPITVDGDKGRVYLAHVLDS